MQCESFDAPFLVLPGDHGGAHGVQPGLARLLGESLFVFGSRLSHVSCLLSFFFFLNLQPLTTRHGVAAGAVPRYGLPQDVSLGPELDSLDASGRHGLFASSFFLSALR